MAIIQEINPSEADVGYVSRPFNEALAEFEAYGYHIVSSEELAKLRITHGKDSNVTNYGSYVKEGFLYVPEKGIFLVRNSPIIANAKQATQGHRKGQEFYLTNKQVEETLVNSVQFKDSSAIPTNRFADDARTAFAFGETAKAYGEFLREIGIKEMPVYLASLENKPFPFARKAWISRADESYGSGLGGVSRDLHCSITVRGVRNVEPRSGDMERLMDVIKSSKQFVPEFVRKDFEKGLESLFKKQ